MRGAITPLPHASSWHGSWLSTGYVFIVWYLVKHRDNFTFTLTNQNDIHDEIKSRLNSGNACYYSIQNLLSSRLISKKLKIKIYKTVILPVLLYGCETWSLTFREEHRLRVFENRVLRRIFGPKREEDGSCRKLHTS
jgi:uncharacterized membrane protein